ncbi:protein translocase subunit SecF [Massilia sp. W12]|uniref:protein translocase subunit SecF n=1 Tax=Massilia sp. W12 TaxID=3126507 RepID=UPI0030D0CAFF
MEFFRIKKDIPFMKHALIFNVISIVTFLAAVFFLWQRGLHLSIEFTGGTEVQFTYAKAANIDAIRKTVIELGFADNQTTTFGRAQDVMIRLPGKAASGSKEVSLVVLEGLCKAEGGSLKEVEKLSEKGELLKKTLCLDAAGKEPLTLMKKEFVGPQIGDELTQNGLKALAGVVICVMAYLAMRFEWKFSVAAIFANLHDVVIILGFFAFFQWEFSLTVLAAVLAVLGYSVNESVVIFDRIRENFRKLRSATVTEVIDNAITSTISRTVITHGSTQLMVLSMLFLGGPTLHYFALALTIGILFGIYSSVFVAAAIAMWLGVKREDLIRPVKEKDENDGAVV